MLHLETWELHAGITVRHFDKDKTIILILDTFNQPIVKQDSAGVVIFSSLSDGQG